MSTGLQKWGLPVGAALLVLAVYAVASWPNGFVYDDHEVILEQKPADSLSDVAWIFTQPHFKGLPYYRPVTRTTLLVQKALHGDAPRAFHLFNAMVAAGSFVVVFFLLQLPAFGVHRVPAFLLGLLLALHPAASSCVYPAASGRETLLPAFFILLTLYAYLRGGRAWYGVAVAAFALALFSKEQAIVLPALVLLSDLLHMRPGPQSWRSRAVRYAPPAVLIVVYLVARLSLFAGSELHLAVLQRPLGPALSLLYSFQALLLPYVSLVYEPTTAVWLSPLRTTAAVLLMAALVVATIRRRADFGRIALFAGCWFVMFQLPTAQILEQEAPYSERYVLLAGFGLVLLLGAWATRLWQADRARMICLAGGILACVGCAAISFHRARFFKDDFSFHSQWQRTNPDSEEALHGYGAALILEGRPQEALAPLTRAIEIMPEYVEAWRERGTAYAESGRPQEAARDYMEAIRLDPADTPSYQKLGNMFFQLGRTTDALTVFLRSIEQVPEYSAGHMNAGAALTRLGRYEEASQRFQEAIRLDPEYLLAHKNLGVALERSGDLAGARREYEWVQRAQPDSADIHVRLCSLSLAQRQLERALSECGEAVDRSPDNVLARFTFGQALAAAGRRREAVEQLQEAARLAPQSAEIRRALSQLEGAGAP